MYETEYLPSLTTRPQKRSSDAFSTFPSSEKRFKTACCPNLPPPRLIFEDIKLVLLHPAARFPDHFLGILDLRQALQLGPRTAIGDWIPAGEHEVVVKAVLRAFSLDVAKTMDEYEQTLSNYHRLLTSSHIPKLLAHGALYDTLGRHVGLGIITAFIDGQSTTSLSRCEHLSSFGRKMIKAAVRIAESDLASRGFVLDEKEGLLLNTERARVVAVSVGKLRSSNLWRA